MPPRRVSSLSMGGQGEIGPVMHAEDGRAGALFLKMQRHVSCVSRGRRSALLFRILNEENDGEQRMRIARMPPSQGMFQSRFKACMVLTTLIRSPDAERSE
jgi:hypothetical protein